jgi:hypothetical protein
MYTYVLYKNDNFLLYLYFGENWQCYFYFYAMEMYTYSSDLIDYFVYIDINTAFSN